MLLLLLLLLICNYIYYDGLLAAVVNGNAFDGDF